jgi:hypothetical protein
MISLIVDLIIISNNMNLLHDKAVCAFPKFDLNFKIYYSKKQKNIPFI